MKTKGSAGKVVEKSRSPASQTQGKPREVVYIRLDKN